MCCCGAEPPAATCDDLTCAPIGQCYDAGECSVDPFVSEALRGGGEAREETVAQKNRMGGGGGLLLLDSCTA